MAELLSKGEGFLHLSGPKTTEFLVTTAMGPGYLDRWIKYSLPSWMSYASRHGLGIVCITDELAERDVPTYKNGSWQKLLAPAFVLANFPEAGRFCMIDTDIVISPFAPNIFDHACTDGYTVVSSLKHLPYPRALVLRRMAFLRNAFYSSSYPLDSFLLGNPLDDFSDLGLEPPSDYFCAGVIALNRGQVDQMVGWFMDTPGPGDFDAWEQTHLNYWIQNEKHEWLPYEWQALWNLEMAWKYPFLYSEGRNVANSSLSRACVEAALWSNNFVHFAGSWFESEAWMSQAELPEFSHLESSFRAYLDTPVTGKKVGKIVPEPLDD